MCPFFDSLDRTELKRMLEVRIADGSLLRLIGKCLHVGVLDGHEVSEPELGTVQGSVLSPLLGNVYLHYVLDLWFETEVKPRLRGQATLIRYCDDFIIGFEREDDARRVMAVLPGAVDTDMTRDFEGAKMAPAEVAAALVHGLAVGAEEVYPGEMAAGRLPRTGAAGVVEAAEAAGRVVALTRPARTTRGEAAAARPVVAGAQRFRRLRSCRIAACSIRRTRAPDVRVAVQR